MLSLGVKGVLSLGVKGVLNYEMYPLFIEGGRLEKIDNDQNTNWDVSLSLKNRKG